MTIVLAVDLGTTAVKVAVVDGVGRTMASSGEVLPMIHVADGGLEQNPEVWWDAIGRCSRNALKQRASVRTGVIDHSSPSRH